jgi:hypothetical protein
MGRVKIFILKPEDYFINTIYIILQLFNWIIHRGCSYTIQVVAIIGTYLYILWSEDFMKSGNGYLKTSQTRLKFTNNLFYELGLFSSWVLIFNSFSTQQIVTVVASRYNNICVGIYSIRMSTLYFRFGTCLISV